MILNGDEEMFLEFLTGEECGIQERYAKVRRCHNQPTRRISQRTQCLMCHCHGALRQGAALLLACHSETRTPQAEPRNPHPAAPSERDGRHPREDRALLLGVKPAAWGKEEMAPEGTSMPWRRRHSGCMLYAAGGRDRPRVLGHPVGGITGRWGPRRRGRRVCTENNTDHPSSISLSTLSASCASAPAPAALLRPPSTKIYASFRILMS